MPGTSRTAEMRAAAPEELLRRLKTLALNLQWTWNPQTQRLFAALDPALWEAVNHNPQRVLAGLSAGELASFAADPGFCELLSRCERELAAYLGGKSWFERTARGTDRRLRVAYFCSEFAIHESMPQYAGGLGVLAGDHLKSASDLGVPLVGVGLLYRHGYYEQRLRPDGSTAVVYPHYDYAAWPLEDTGRVVAVALGRRSVHLKIWKLQVGRTALYLLDADIPANQARERALTHYLYGGDAEYRLAQQVLLGVGGRRALAELGIRPTVYHLNEGHAAFCGLERLRELRARGHPFDKAVGLVRASTVFTTHTPVPAGHNRYPPKLVLKYLGPLVTDAGLDRDTLLALGREDPHDRKEPFCMTVLALRLSGRVNAVSRLHGQVSRAMWQKACQARSPGQVPIGHVTNGVHPQTWLAAEARPLYRRYLRPRWPLVSPAETWADRAGRIPPAEFWALRNALRARLVAFIRQQLARQIQRRLGPVQESLAAYQTFDAATLTIGFARRFATYKRALLIFEDPQRLARILNDPQRPVQLVFAGKAHPNDAPGQEFVRRVYQQARRHGFAGRVAVLEDYDLHVARLLVSGCDVWLNNPIRPLEACGTSGMKAALHGGLNCSILDGWWPEAYNGRNGWAIRAADAGNDERQRDRQEAAALYDLLEQQIVPLFHERGPDGVPRRWVRMMVSAVRSVGGRFSSHRMLGQYLREYYLPAHRVRRR